MPRTKKKREKVVFVDVTDEYPKIKSPTASPEPPKQMATTPAFPHANFPPLPKFPPLLRESQPPPFQAKPLPTPPPFQPLPHFPPLLQQATPALSGTFAQALSGTFA
ncbi:MAG: hypothetical protein H6727_04850, partial [Myxococcales bacterium]|nr:hypothetical protein [Myxococcales bacterium]